MSERASHNLPTLLGAGYVDTGARLSACPGPWLQARECRRMNIALDSARTVRVALDPDVWAVLTVPGYKGEPFAEPGAMLPA